VRYRYDVNRTGIVYVAITLLVGVSAVTRPNNMLVWVFGLMLALIAIGGLVSGAALYRMSLRRLDPSHGRVGRPMVVRYAVRSGSRRMPLFDVSLREVAGSEPGDWSTFTDPETAWLLHAAPGEIAHAESVLVPMRRGRLRFGRFEASSSFPFGLLRKSVQLDQPMETLVYPRTVPLAGDAIERLLGRGGDGDRPGRAMGSFGEFAGVREYLPGDSLRSIAWKRWIHDERPVVVQRSLPAPRRMILVLDLRRSTSDLRVADGVDPRATEERAITLAASLAETALELGVEVGLRLPGTSLLELPVRGGRRHLDRLLSQLAAIELDRPRTGSSPAVPAPTAASLVVIHPDRVDTSIGHDSAWHLLPSSLDELGVDAGVVRGAVA
jgi:uncharacterized protein (DUF58 family)